MPMPPAPVAGYRNCSRCTRWRPVIDFPPGRTHRRDGSLLEPPQLSAWCDSCRRAAARARARAAYARRKAERAKVVSRARRRVERGEAVWVAPLRAWATGRPLTLLCELAGLDASNVRRGLHPDALTISIGIADRLLLAAGERLDDLYPYEEPHVGAVAA